MPATCDPVRIQYTNRPEFRRKSIAIPFRVAAMLQLAASPPAFSSCNECAYHQLQDDLLTEPLELLDGMLTV
ncbi:MAG: hypothetical protein HQ582_34800, partial [Planctomycetes bacterium]|nr:hypothetical protein [Planctomycetota bacterium]